MKAYLLALGDDVQMKTLDFYIAFRRLKNFACVEIRPQLRHIKIYLKVDLDTVPEDLGFTRDMRNTSHFGTGDVEVIVSDMTTFEKAKPLMERSYDGA